MFDITPMTYFIVCPLVFLGGFVDSIAGGGGLITMPAYMFAGLPVHLCVGTNKVSSTMGTSVSVWRAFSKGLMRWPFVLPGVLCSVAGAQLGVRVALALSERTFSIALLCILPFCVFVVMNRKLFDDCGSESVNASNVTKVSVLSFIVGMYDGFYGPGTGTFLLIGYISIAGLSLNTAYSTTKAVNWASNISSFIVYLMSGRTVLVLGLVAGLCNMAGNYFGSALALKNGTKIVRPVILVVVCLLVMKIAVSLFQ